MKSRAKGRMWICHFKKVVRILEAAILKQLKKNMYMNSINKKTKEPEQLREIEIKRSKSVQ